MGWLSAIFRFFLFLRIDYTSINHAFYDGVVAIVGWSTGGNRSSAGIFANEFAGPWGSVITGSTQTLILNINGISRTIGQVRHGCLSMGAVDLVFSRCVSPMAGPTPKYLR